MVLFQTFVFYNSSITDRYDSQQFCTEEFNSFTDYSHYLVTFKRPIAQAHEMEDTCLVNTQVRNISSFSRKEFNHYSTYHLQTLSHNIMLRVKSRSQVTSKKQYQTYNRVRITIEYKHGTFNNDYNTILNISLDQLRV